MQDVYGEPKIFKFPGMTVRVYQPILTDEERAKRMKRIEQAAAELLIEQEKLISHENTALRRHHTTAAQEGQGRTERG